MVEHDDAVGVLRDVPGLVVAVPAHPSDAPALFRTCLAAARAEGLWKVYGAGDTQVVAGNQNWFTRIQGTDIDLPVIRAWPTRVGAFFGPQDVAGAVLLDTRATAEFDRGHLPGALSWDWFNAVPAGSWNVSRDPEELRAEWRALGFDASDEVTVYCRSGMRAAHTYVVLRAAGFRSVRLYDGSWQEWSMKKLEESDG